MANTIRVHPENLQDQLMTIHYLLDDIALKDFYINEISPLFRESSGPNLHTLKNVNLVLGVTVNDFYTLLEHTKSFINNVHTSFVERDASLIG